MLRPGKSHGTPTYGGGGYSNGSYSNGGGYNGNGYSNGGGYNGYSNGGAYGSNGGGYSQGGGQSYGGYSGESYSPASSVRRSTSKYRRDQESPIMNLLKKPLFYCSIGCFLLACTSMHYRGKHNKILKELGERTTAGAIERVEDIQYDRNRYVEDAKKESRFSRNLEHTLDELKEESRKLQLEHDDLRDHHSSIDQDLRKSARRDGAWRKQAMLMQDAVKKESKRTALERFGPGPHHVIFKVVVPGSNEEEEFVVEMAPLDLMPHAVHLFLEQTFHGLWDGIYIYWNNEPALHAGPQEWFDEVEGASWKPFKDRNLDSLAFPEYSPDYPHKHMTLGYSGRPGGVEWYINKKDNVEKHGPHGQTGDDYVLAEQADPCFGKVISGHDLLERMTKLPTSKPGTEWEYFFDEPVQIVSARIKEQLPPPDKVPDHHKTEAELEAARKAHHHKKQRKIHHDEDEESTPVHQFPL